MPYYKMKRGKMQYNGAIYHEGDIFKGPAEKFDTSGNVQKVLPSEGNWFMKVRHGIINHQGREYHQGDIFEAVEETYLDEGRKIAHVVIHPND